MKVDDDDFINVDRHPSIMNDDVFNLKKNIKACYGIDASGEHGFGELFIH